MNTLIICVTIVACVFIVCHYTDKLIDKTIERKSLESSMSDDIDTIEHIVDRTCTIDFYNDTVKHNLLTIKYIISKYVEENEDVDTSTKES